ncbi:MbnH family di-heme enzyme [Piscinibacter sakaiensis]|uniref:MbnH family di-heme enzyme n=1 Tax=Piscinibacter sakaiensis TaxID=1547922 RepID=UPI0037290889
MPPPAVPADNPMSAAKVELGRHLFHDVRLSANGAMSCATCHDQARAFTDGQAVSRGVAGEAGTRSAMSLANVAYLPVLTWQNPQLTSLEVQALIPLFGEHPVEMGLAGREQQLFAMFKADPTYRRLFAQAFPAEAGQGEGGPYALSTLTKALASFQRSLMSFDSPYDRYRYGGQKDAISAAAKRGEELFFGEKLECYHCHGGFNFTDNLKHARTPFPEIGFHNTGLYNEDGRGAYPKASPGIVEFTGEPRDAGRFRTPSLRNVAVTAPYMHDGSIATLHEVLRTHYARAGRAVHAGLAANPLRSEFIAGFEISEAEIADVVAFLESLTDERFLRDPAHQNPWRNDARPTASTHPASIRPVP